MQNFNPLQKDWWMTVTKSVNQHACISHETEARLFCHTWIYPWWISDWQQKLGNQHTTAICWGANIASYLITSFLNFLPRRANGRYVTSKCQQAKDQLWHFSDIMNVNARLQSKCLMKNIGVMWEQY